MSLKKSTKAREKKAEAEFLRQNFGERLFRG